MSQFANPEQDLYARKLILPSGTSDSPSIVFANDQTQGFYYDVAAGLIKAVGFDGGGGGGGATPALDNLASVAINTSLLPAIDNSIDLGSGGFTFKDLHLTGNATMGTIFNGDGTSGAPSYSFDSDTTRGFYYSGTSIALKGPLEAPGQKISELATLSLDGSDGIYTSDVDDLILGTNSLNSPSSALTFSGDGSMVQLQVHSQNPFDVNGSKITSVQNPTSAQDAATKSYVDSAGANTSLSNLTNPTAINRSLIFNANNTYQVGNESNKLSILWSLVYGLHNTSPIDFISADTANVSLRVDGSTGVGVTGIWVYDFDNAVLARVTVGVADSGGVGFKVLRIPN